MTVEEWIAAHEDLFNRLSAEQSAKQFGTSVTVELRKLAANRRAQAERLEAMANDQSRI